MIICAKALDDKASESLVKIPCVDMHTENLVNKKKNSQKQGHTKLAKPLKESVLDISHLKVKVILT